MISTKKKKYKINYIIKFKEWKIMSINSWMRRDKLKKGFRLFNKKYDFSISLKKK